MNKLRSIKTVCTVGFLLTLLGTACTDITDNVATTAETQAPVNRVEPTATQASGQGMLRYEQGDSGYALEYPEDWGPVAFTIGPTFAESYDDYAGLRGPFFITTVLDRTGELANIGGTQQGMVDQTLAFLDNFFPLYPLSECNTGEPEPWTFGETEGTRVEGSCEALDTRILIGVALGRDLIGFVIAIAPADTWAEHKPTLERMFASVEFFPPGQGGPNIVGKIRPGETVRGAVCDDHAEAWQFQVDKGDRVTFHVVPIKSGEFGMTPRVDVHFCEALGDKESYFTENGTPVPPDQVDWIGSGTYSMTLSFSAEEDDECYVVVFGGPRGTYELAFQIED